MLKLLADSRLRARLSCGNKVASIGTTHHTIYICILDIWDIDRGRVALWVTDLQVIPRRGNPDFLVVGGVLTLPAGSP
jgi:hypothetical protein